MAKAPPQALLGALVALLVNSQILTSLVLAPSVLPGLSLRLER
jgi:hypothetical protein